MKILRDIISGLEDFEVKKVACGLFVSAVVSKRCGLACVLRPQEQSRINIKNAGTLENLSVKELAKYSLSENLYEACIGIAAINSALLIAKKTYEVNGFDIILEKSKGKTVGLIGHFPFADKLKNHAKKLMVFEKNLQPGDYPSEKIPQLLPKADIVAMTGTTLINHTFEGIMKSCSKNAYVIMLGPSTPLSPILFDYGVNAICGSIVTDTKTTLRQVIQGAGMKELKGKRYLTISYSR